MLLLYLYTLPSSKIINIFVAQNKRVLSLKTLLLIFLAMSYYHGAEEQSLWAKLNSRQGTIREEKTLRSTFPFSEVANYQHHQDGHRVVTTNARSSHGASFPGQGIIPPSSGTFTFINI